MGPRQNRFHSWEKTEILSSIHPNSRNNFQWGFILVTAPNGNLFTPKRVKWDGLRLDILENQSLLTFSSHLGMVTSSKISPYSPFLHTLGWPPASHSRNCCRCQDARSRSATQSNSIVPSVANVARISFANCGNPHVSEEIIGWGLKFLGRLEHKTQAIRATLGRHELRQLRPNSNALETREHDQPCLKPLCAAVSLAR